MDFDLLTIEAKRRRVDLAAAYEAAGLSRTTLWRHRKNRFLPDVQTVRRILTAMSDLAPARGPAVEHWSDDLLRQFVALRHERSLTQGVVEDRLGVTTALVGKWEAKMRRPGVFLLTCWADALDARLVLVPMEKLAQVQAILGRP